jgi:predicted CXXCH cytochrome family protein
MATRLTCGAAGRALGGRIGPWVLSLALLFFAAPLLAGSTGCTTCHAGLDRGLGPAHAGLAAECVRCHGGDATSGVLPAAHRELIAYPGLLANAARACGPCHADKVASVSHGLMSSGTGIVRRTRQVLGEPEVRDGLADLSHLGTTPADSLLRKECASCHLGQPKREHRVDATLDRGGGCLACHVDHYPAGAHPPLTAVTSDGRCFGCHSRSGRVSLSYAGLAETLPSTRTAGARGGPMQLADGRPVARKPDDTHHAAGLSCIDCHTEAEVMGLGPAATSKSAALDVACADCHVAGGPRTSVDHWPARYAALLRRVPFAVDRTTQFVVTARHGTPLWNVELRPDGAWVYPKAGGEPVHAPPYTSASHAPADRHRRLTCSSCHSQWAPQCYGCHLSYQPQGEQWDFEEARSTPGHWSDQQWDTRAELPTLGVDRSDRIVPVIPGMIMTVRHPSWASQKFARRFAALEPHTTGPGRSCSSCHQSGLALGLGSGALRADAGQWTFVAAKPLLQDGLPADAWTRLKAPAAARDGEAVRPFSAVELQRILNAPLNTRSQKPLQDAERRPAPMAGGSNR